LESTADRHDRPAVAAYVQYTTWAEGQGWYKVLQNMACGVATAVSDVSRGAGGRHDLLAPEWESWTGHIGRLLDDDAL
jgi:hypothetical protein